MKFGKSIKKAAVAGLIAIAAYSYQHCLQKIMFNSTGRDLNEVYVSRADGYLHSTALITDGYHDTAIKRVFLGTEVFMIDNDGIEGKKDGLADIVAISKPFRHSILISRKRDYIKFREQFNEADKVLAETKDRFKGIVTTLETSL